jgi:hypothetical protein
MVSGVSSILSLTLSHGVPETSSPSLASSPSFNAKSLRLKIETLPSRVLPRLSRNARLRACSNCPLTRRENKSTRHSIMCFDVLSNCS